MVVILYGLVKIDLRQHKFATCCEYAGSKWLTVWMIQVDECIAGSLYRCYCAHEKVTRYLDAICGLVCTIRPETAAARQSIMIQLVDDLLGELQCSLVSFK